MKDQFKLLSLTLILLLFTAETKASGMASVDSSVSSMAKGGSGSADISDISSIYKNPANALYLNGFSLSAGAVMAVPGISANLDGEEIKPENGAKVPPLIHAGYTKGNLGFGYSFTVPFGSSVAWPENWLKRFDLQKAEIAVLRQSAFAGLRFGKIAFAGGLFFDSAKLNLTRSIDFIEAEGKVDVKTQANALGGFGGITYRHSPYLSFGASYRSKSNLDFKGSANFERPVELSGKTKNGLVDAPITMPGRFLIGTKYSPLSKLNFSLDLEYTGWSSYEKLVIDFLDEENTDQIKQKDWQNTVALRFGAEWKALENLELGFGGFYDESPVPDSSAGPDSPDSDRLGLSLGATFNISKELELNVAYQSIFLSGRTVSDELERSLELGGNVHLLGTSLSLNL